MKCSEKVFLIAVLQSLAEENQETKVTVDAVHLKVDQTHKDVQDIKSILDSCKCESEEQHKKDLFRSLTII